MVPVSLSHVRCLLCTIGYPDQLEGKDKILETQHSVSHASNYIKQCGGWESFTVTFKYIPRSHNSSAPPKNTNSHFCTFAKTDSQTENLNLVQYKIYSQVREHTSFRENWNKNNQFKLTMKIIYFLWTISKAFSLSVRPSCNTLIHTFLHQTSQIS